MNDGLSIGVLMSHVRAEEKQLLAALAQRGAEPIRMLDRSLAFELTDPLRPQPQPLDLVLDRAMAHGRAAVAMQCFSACGVRCVNSARASNIADDKVATSLTLAMAGVPSIRTYAAFDVEAALKVLETQVGYPAVIKPITGSWGRLLAKVNTPEAARSVMEHKKALGSFQHGVFYIQQYIEKPGRDLRIFVVNGEVIAGSYRTAEHWVTNVARGAISRPCPITPEIAEIATAATGAIGLELAGVDLVETPDGLQVIEVNTGVEFKGLIKTTDVDIAGVVADYVVQVARDERARRERGEPALTAAGVRRQILGSDGSVGTVESDTFGAS